MTCAYRGGSGKTKIKLKIAEPLGGDTFDLLAVTFKFAPGEKLWSEQSELLRYVFGKYRDVSNVPDSVNLEAAISSARGKAKNILEKGRGLENDGIRMLVAIQLVEVKEVVWAEVVTWNGVNGVGILLSNPMHDKKLKSGVKYDFSYDSIMDFKLYGPDGIIDKG
ncbi:MAG: hypothetical protein KUG73_06565 [Pseudomonadales bacterium]|nr:hypothetical protein [Pseudomonadales bacterium]